MLIFELLLLCFVFREVITAVDDVILDNNSSSLIPVNDTSTTNGSTAVIPRFNIRLILTES